jgi:hypothetical protein
LDPFSPSKQGRNQKFIFLTATGSVLDLECCILVTLLPLFSSFGCLSIFAYLAIFLFLFVFFFLFSSVNGDVLHEISIIDN